MIIRRLGQIALAVMLVLASLGVAEARDRTVTVKFPKGANGTTIADTIKGRDTVKYKLAVRAGQKLSVQLDTDNPSSYFNITAPGASEALFIGSISGNSTTFDIPSSGTYVINVYLMRNAARRGESANYSLTLYVENAASSAVKPSQPASNDGVSMANMPRFCAGEASARYGVRPQDLTTNMAFKSGNRYVVQGYFDGSAGTTFFNCWFKLDGSFISVS